MPKPRRWPGWSTYCSKPSPTTRSAASKSNTTAFMPRYWESKPDSEEPPMPRRFSFSPAPPPRRWRSITITPPGSLHSSAANSRPCSRTPRLSYLAARLRKRQNYGRPLTPSTPRNPIFRPSSERWRSAFRQFANRLRNQRRLPLPSPRGPTSQPRAGSRRRRR